MNRRVKKAKGKVADANSVSFSLSWDDRVDLDIHCAMPYYRQCYFGNKRPSQFISLDVDKREHDRDQVENIVLDTTQCDDGQYKYFVRYYSGHGRPTTFKFVLNQFGEEVYQGEGVALPNPKDKGVVILTIKDGKVVNTDFKLKTTHVSTLKKIAAVAASAASSASSS